MYSIDDNLFTDAGNGDFTKANLMYRKLHKALDMASGNAVDGYIVNLEDIEDAEMIECTPTVPALVFEGYVSTPGDRLKKAE